MTISVLVCKEDGSQVLEQREVDENYFRSLGPFTKPDEQESLDGQA